MSDIKKQIVEMADVYGKQSMVNEDHKIVIRDSNAESRLLNAFTNLMNDINGLEYMVRSLPYYEKNSPSEVIEQSNKNLKLMKRLKFIAYKKLEEVKEVIDDVLCPPEEKEEKVLSVTFEAGHESPKDEIPFYSKKTKKKKRMYEASLQEMALSDLKGIDIEKDTPEKIAKHYVKQAKERGLDKSKIIKGLGSTFRGLENKELAVKLKETIKKELEKEEK